MADILLTGATVWLGPHPAPHPAWLLLRDGRVAAIGAPHLLPPDVTDRHTLPGHHVLPGFVDAHTHLSIGAFLSVAGDASAWRTTEDALRAVEATASLAPAGSWVLFLRLELAAWRDAVPPTAEELEAAAGGRPVLLADVTLHRGILSASGLRRCGLTAGAPDPHGDLARGRGGRLTGVVWEAAFARGPQHALRELAAAIDDAGLDRLLAREARRHLQLGIVRAHDPGVPPDVDRRLRVLRTPTPLRLSWAAASPEGLLVPPPPPAVDGHDGGEGPPATKLFTDGAHRCALCLPAGVVVAASLRAVRAALAGDVSPFRQLLADPVRFAGHEVRVPYLRFDDAGLLACARPHAEAGRRLRIHALGNLAVRQTVGVLRLLRPGCGAVLEHVMLLTDGDCDLVAASGAAITVQPGFIPGYGRALLDRGLVGPLRVLPLASLVARGVPLAISSDSPCGPLDPLLTVRLAVSRRLGDGTPLDAREAVDRSVALRAATIGGAIAIGHPAARGIAPGEPADFAVCDGDPFEAATRVVATWIAGRRVWSADEEGAAD